MDIVVRPVAVNVVLLSAKRLLKEMIGHVDMQCPLLARLLHQTAQSAVKLPWNVVTVARARVANVEWVAYISGVKRRAGACWFVLMIVKRPALNVHHAPPSVKIVAYITIVIRNVASRVSRVT